MAIVLDGTSGITNDSGYTGDGVSFADSTPANTLVTTSDGNVGIGTSSPATKLVLAGNNSLLAENNTLRFWDTDNATQTNQQVGKIEFYSADATAPGPSVKAYMGAFADDSSPGVYMAFATDAETGTATERLRITSAGNVGIGTSSPFEKLTVFESQTSGTNVDLFSIRTASDGIFTIRCSDLSLSSPAWAIRTGNAEPLTFVQSATERMRIDSSGNLLVGTTTRLNSTSFAVLSGGNISEFRTTVGSCDAVAFYTSSSTLAGRININGTTTSYLTSSDYRLKHDIQPMTGALAKVAQLKPVTYKWNADDSQSQGFIAHELQEVVPECVTGEKDAVDAEGNPQYQGIDTSFLVATLTAAIQELKGINDAQAQIITALTARVEALEGAQA
jgi:hypothetical protein